MIDVVSVFVKEIENIRSLILYFDLEAKMSRDRKDKILEDCDPIMLELASSYSKMSLVKRKFNYNTFVISLYGAFERFIEDLIVGYLDEVIKIVPNYTSLPEKIIESHFLLSIDLLKKVVDPKYSGIYVKEDILKNLNDCVALKKPIILNTKAFTLHGANFKQSVISEVISRLGIETLAVKLLKNTSLKSFVQEYHGLQSDAVVKDEAMSTILGDLVARRNEVAHGNISVLLSVIDMQVYLDYFKYYASAIFEVLGKELLPLQVNFKAIEIGPVDALYHGGKTVCFFSNNVPLSVGDRIIGKNTENIVQTEILSIKLNNRTRKHLKGDQNYDVGIKIDISFKSNYTLFLVKN